ncbi:hypothetical protein [Streptomyces sp. NPDC020965]|uniref:hypothetical protein n=1 Tax=Streptomyces sp. NPDC020965 TaxID=3365105 RepID=UPI0037B76CA8
MNRPIRKILPCPETAVTARALTETDPGHNATGAGPTASVMPVIAEFGLGVHVCVTISDQHPQL